MWASGGMAYALVLDASTNRCRGSSPLSPTMNFKERLDILCERVLTEHKEFRKIIKKVEQQGWEVEHTRKGHIKFRPPNPEFGIIIASGTPSDHRALKNLVARLRRAGAII